MPYVLGVDIGGDNAYAAVCRRDVEGWGEATAAPLGNRSTAIGSTLLVSTTGAPAPRDGSGHDGSGEPQRSIRGYIRRVGDDVPFMIGNMHYPAHELAATMIRWIVDRVWAVEGEPAEQIMFACPAGWGLHREGQLRDALRNAGLTDVMFIAAPLAATVGHTAGGPAATAGGEPAATGVFAVYDLGDSGFTGSVVERHAGGAMEVIGSVEVQVGGADLDDALVAHVEARAGLTRHAGGDSTAGDPDRRISTMSWLRGSCATARERLSVAAEAVVPVPTSGGQIDVVMTRAELAELARPLLQPTVDSLARLVRAVPQPTDPAAVLLAGEATRTPGLDELIAAQLPAPVLSDPHPGSIVARGAALAARRVVTRTRAAFRPHGASGQE
jgi:molecular chaperone DnaK (HSP70)